MTNFRLLAAITGFRDSPDYRQPVKQAYRPNTSTEPALTPPPEPPRAPKLATASEALEANISRAINAYDKREAELVEAIATREAELADIRRARTAAHAARATLHGEGIFKLEGADLVVEEIKSTCDRILADDSEFNRIMKGGRS